MTPLARIHKGRGPKAPLLAWRSLTLLALCATLRLGADPIRLWPGAAPGDRGDLGKEADSSKADSPRIAGRWVIRLANVSEPTIEVFRPPASKATGTAVLVCPGGGFYILAMDLEGTEVCRWLNSMGVTAVLLKYRVPRREGRPPLAAPLQDAQRALGIVRSRAAQWGIDPGRIGVLGFSAGGELAAALSAGNGSRSYPRVDACDDVSCRPDFQVLVYPAYLGPVNGSPNPDVAVTRGTPPTFMVVAADDPVVDPGTAMGYVADLNRAKVPVEFLLYPSGGHGFGLRPTRDLVTSWPQRAAEWMRSRGLLDAPAAGHP